MYTYTYTCERMCSGVGEEVCVYIYMKYHIHVHTYTFTVYAWVADRHTHSVSLCSLPSCGVLFFFV